MKCDRVQELFSDIVDGTRSRATDAARSHVSSCTACAAELERFQAAVRALRAQPAHDTAPHVRTAVLAAVDAAVREDARADEEEYRRAALLAAARFERRTRRRRVLTHVTAVLAGAALVLLWLSFSRAGEGAGREPARPDARLAAGGAERGGALAGSSDSPESAAWRGTVVQVERIPFFVEVPGPVEVRVVERIVEKEVERVVRRGPLVAVDLSGFADALASAGSSLERAARQQSDTLLALAELEAVREERLSPPLARRPAGAEPRGMEGESRRQLASRGRESTSVLVRRTGPNLTLETSGTLAEVVPVLLSKLGDEDEEIVGLVQRQLEAIREDALAHPVLAERLREPRPQERPRRTFRLFGGRDEGPAGAPNSFSDWWALNAALIAQAEADGTL